MGFVDQLLARLVGGCPCDAAMVGMWRLLGVEAERSGVMLGRGMCQVCCKAQRPLLSAML